MWRVLIADDEAWIRRGLRDEIEQLDMELECVGEARDGAEAIDLAERWKPHIVITDIRMPGLDGVEVMRYLHETYPDTQIVVVSVYSDFEFAKKAITFGVHDYLLKPIEAEELEQTMTEAIRKLREADRLRQKTPPYVDRQSRVMIKQHMLAGMFAAGKATSESLQNEISPLGYEWGGGPHAVAVFRPLAFETVRDNRFHGDEEALRFAFYNIVSELAGGEGEQNLFFYNERNDLVLLASLACVDGNNEFRDLRAWTETVCHTVYGFIGLTLTSGHRDEADRSINEQYASVLAELELATGTDLIHNDERRMLLYLIEHQYAKTAVETASTLYARCSRSRSEADGAAAVRQLSFEVSEMLRRYGITAMPFEPEALPADSSSFAEWVEDAVRKLRQSTMQGVTKTIHEIIADMQENYGDTINLATMAQRYYLSPSYLSRTFKQETGTTFSDYLSGIRMNKASELLLEPELKIHDLSRLVGYDNVSYFFRKFKDYFGCTPSDYRERMQSKKVQSNR